MRTLGIPTVKELSLSGKQVFLRVDFNVPLSEAQSDQERSILDDNRIQEALPTVRYILDQGGKLILASHLGRPKGKQKIEYSLEPIARHLAHLLNQEVLLAQENTGESLNFMVRRLKPGCIMMLENLRFHPGEESNDPIFAKQLASLAEVYINDAFGTAHRKHASTYGVPQCVQEKGVGFLMEKELLFLEPLLKEPQRPFYALLGGSKVSDKIKTIESLMRHVNGLIIGGAMGHAFWLAQGHSLPEGAKTPQSQDIEAARFLMKQAETRNTPLITPIDTNNGFDIGPKTIELFTQHLSQAKTIFWNGPLGWFEKPDYAHGTFAIAKAMASWSAIKIVGGGDTVSAIQQSGYQSQFDHLSTGGGAVLEFLEGHSLPGIEILRTKLITNPLKTANTLSLESEIET